MVPVLMTLLWGWPVRWTAREGSPAASLNDRGDGDRSQPRFDDESQDPEASGAAPPRRQPKTS